MATNIPLSERFKQTAVRRVIEEAAQNDMDYNEFYTRASSLGLNNNPQILNYAELLKEKQMLEAKTRENLTQQQRQGEVESISQEAMKGRPYEMQPNQFKRSYETPSLPEPGKEIRDEQGQLQLPSRMPTLEMHPTGIAKPGYGEPETFEQAYRRTGQIAQERGASPITTEQFKQYWAGPMEKDVVSQQGEEADRAIKQQQQEQDFQLKQQQQKQDYEIKKQGIYQRQQEIDMKKGAVDRDLLNQQIEDQRKLLETLQGERDDINNQLSGTSLVELDDTAKENLKMRKDQLQGEINQLLKDIPANTQWMRLYQQKPGKYVNERGILKPQSGQAQGNDTPAMVAQAKAAIKRLEYKGNLTTEEIADLEELKKFVAKQESTQQGDNKYPPITLENSLLDNPTLPGSRDERYVRGTR